MSRYTQLFTELKAKNEGAFVPFMTIGDPNLENSYKILCALIEGGADALELGIPFSDPGADGPVIQRSDKRDLSKYTNWSTYVFKLGLCTRNSKFLPNV